MVNIKVPIGKGIVKTTNELKFPNLKRSQPDKEGFQAGTFPSIPSDKQFLKDIADQDRLVLEQGTIAGQGDLIVFTPPNGSTFYFIEAFCSNTGVGRNEYNLIVEGTTIETIEQAAISQIRFLTTIFKLIGDGTRNVTIDRTDSSGSANCTLVGYLENSVRQ